jgi:hypothetical protein
MKPTRDQIMAVECAACGASRGSMCRQVYGRHRDRSTPRAALRYFHGARIGEAATIQERKRANP